MARKSRKITETMVLAQPEQLIYNAGAYIRLSSDARRKPGDSLENQQAILAGTFEGPLIRHIDSLPASAYEHCADVSFERIYRSRDVLDIELAGFRIIGPLLQLMTDAVCAPEKAYSQLLINRVSSQYKINSPVFHERIQAVLDYISGMTDVFALDLYRKINGNSLPTIS